MKKVLKIGGNQTINIDSTKRFDLLFCTTSLPRETAKSRQVVSDLSPNERRALREEVLKILEILHDRVDDWIDDSLELNEAGDVITVSFNILVDDIEADGSERDFITSQEFYKLKEHVEQVLNESV